MNNLKEEIIQILAYTALSPSGHNTQPWKVEVNTNSEIIIQSDSSRWLPQVDPSNKETFLSLAAFAETMKLASLEMGYDSEINIVANDLKDKDIFKVKFKEISPIKNNNLNLIKKRVTTRTNYDTKVIRPDQINEITNIAPELIKYYPLDSNEGKWIADNLPQAIEEQSFNDQKQKELSNWLRFTKEEAKDNQDGLTAEALGMNWIARFLWYSFFNEKTAMGNSFRKKAVDTAKEQVKNCSGFLVITSKDNSIDSLFETGKIYQKASLKLTELGILHHTMSQLLEEEPWANEIKSSLKLKSPVQFVMRIGYGEPAAPSIRRPVDSFLVS